MASEGSDDSGILEVIRSRIAGAGRALTYAEFIEIALYHPEFGYYTRRQRRVGRRGDTDFFTSTSSGKVFRDLVIQSCETLLAPSPLADYAFIEIGAEPESGLFGDHDGWPFREVHTIGLGTPLSIPDPAIVFSNELFDAQPFHRLKSEGAEWKEIGVELAGNALRETFLPELSDAVRGANLPPPPAEDYHLDLSLAAESLLERIVQDGWSGLFLAFDYGKTREELFRETPQGTARAYYRHHQTNDLLNRPGEQDLTCHVFWDALITRLEKRGFANISFDSQERFFIHNATKAIEKIVMINPGQFDPDRQSLQQLLHPGNMGQKFQVLSARRK